MKKRAPHEAAAREAFEEAGLKGTVDARAIGSYQYDKKLKDGAVVLCRVDVFPMRVSKQRRRWPEYEQRETRWFDPHEAASCVEEAELASLIGGLEALLRRETICPVKAKPAGSGEPAGPELPAEPDLPAEAAQPPEAEPASASAYIA